MSASAVAERTATMDGGRGSAAEAAELAPDLRAHVSFAGHEGLGLEDVLRVLGQPPEDGADAGEGGRWLTVDELAARIVEDLPPGPAMAGWLASAAPANLDGFALAGTAAAWRRLAAWATAGELATVAEMTTRAAARDGSDELERGGGPGQVSDGAVAEIGLALRMSRFGAEMWADLAVTLSWRLPRTLAALSQGAIDLSRARLIAETTSVLDEADAAAVEDKVLENAGWQTPGQLRAALRRAVISVDPAAAERRREEAERRASVGLYGDPEGTATLAGHNLPGGQAVAAMARVTALAQAMKAAGAAGGIDLLRAQVFIGLLLNTLPFIPPPQEDPEAPGPPGPGEGGLAGPAGRDTGGGPAEPGTGGPPDDPTGDVTPTDEPTRDVTPPDEPTGDVTPQDENIFDVTPQDGNTGAVTPPGANTGDVTPPDRRQTAATAGRGATARSMTAQPWPGLPARTDVPSAGRLSGRPGRVTLTVPLQTLTGASPEPGTLCWLGPVTPLVARQIAEARARDPRTEWRVIVTGSSGEFICVARIRRRARSRAGPHDATAGGPSPGRAAAGLIDRVTVVVPVDLLGHDGRERARSGRSGLAAMLTAALTTARRAHARAVTAAPHRARSPDACGHADHEPQYRPSTRLRAIIMARDQTCRFPGCRQPAWHTDLDHSIAYERGGPTCSCNLGAACRSHHKVKQERGWRLEQPVPGFFTWITPSGRRYDVTPDAYPI